MRRLLLAEEKAVLDALLRGGWPGSDQLRQQVEAAYVTGKCGCGCATVHLTVDEAKAAPAPPQNPAPVEATVWNEDRSRAVGGILLFAPHGWLSSLEIYSVDDDPIKVFPPLDLIDFEPSK